MKKIFNTDFSENKNLQEAQKLLKEWDLGTDFENEYAAFGVCILSPEWLAEIKREAQPDPLEVFTDCVDEMNQNFGSLSVPWNKVNFLDRNKKMIPIQGGPDVLRAVYAPRSDDGILKAVAGDGLYIYVVWDKDKKQISESIHQYGSATIDRNSKHYDDQMQLFADEKLKDTFFDHY
jgi:penicillin amidase/acyl-homoserine-lactone acylase